MHNAAKSSVSAIEEKVKEATDDVDTVYRTFESFGTILPVVTLVAYYVAYFVVHRLNYDATIFGGLAIAAPLALILRVILNQMHTRLQFNKMRTLEHVKAARERLGAFLVKRLNIGLLI